MSCPSTEPTIESDLSVSIRSSWRSGGESPLHCPMVGALDRPSLDHAGAGLVHHLLSFQCDKAKLPALDASTPAARLPASLSFGHT